MVVEEEAAAQEGMILHPAEEDPVAAAGPAAAVPVPAAEALQLCLKRK
jgi:hypothetical protein